MFVPSTLAYFVDLSQKVECKIQAFPSNLPSPNSSNLPVSVLNRHIEQQTSVLTFFSIPQSDLIVKTCRSHKKNWVKKLKKKTCFFFQIFSQNLFVEF